MVQALFKVSTQINRKIQIKQSGNTAYLYLLPTACEVPLHITQTLQKFKLKNSSPDRTEVPSALTMSGTVFWNVTLCNCLEVLQMLQINILAPCSEPKNKLIKQQSEMRWEK
jgi:hypothetical protein